MLNIEESKQTYTNALWHLGFRPFFIVAGVFATLSMLLWLVLSHFTQAPLVMEIVPSVWHGHEMVYGYSMAVIAGFLLTAVQNWTGVKTLSGTGLVVLVLLWCLARIMPFINITSAPWVMALSDLAFMLGLILAVVFPIVKVRQWKQLGIVTILLVMATGNSLFYLSLLKEIQLPLQFSVYLGLYFVLALILLMARRVVPFFIEKGVDETVTIKNWFWLDVLVIVFFIFFVLSRLAVISPTLTMSLSLVLVVLNGIRLWQWHTPGIWRKPLLWILYLAYTCLVLAFVLFAIPSVSAFIALHAFAVGGIGLMTLGMMCRVALGHTGRNVSDPPLVLIPIFSLMLLAVISRVVLPLIAVQQYNLWIIISQVFWILSFVLFSWVYIPILYKPRVDGRYG